MSVLSMRTIQRLVDEQNLIENFDFGGLEGASYDMRMGSNFVKHGEKQLLIEQSPSLIIEPGDFVILSTLEILNMPLNVTGHNGIMSGWAKRGIVSLFSPQIDPGFRGFLVVPVFNAGDTPVTMSLRDKIFTVEFLYTDEPAPFAWADRFSAQLDIPPFKCSKCSPPEFIGHQRQSRKT